MNIRVIITDCILGMGLLCGIEACSAKPQAASTDGSRGTSVHVMGSICGDSAYRFVEEQLACGVRVPGSEGHATCVRYICGKLAQYDADTVVLNCGTVTAYDGTRLPATNIIGRYNTDATRRILLAAHYDTRPWADRDADEENRDKPIPGANDGASGVAVLLEVARNFSIKAPDVGVDIAFLDCEDYGNSGSDEDSGWCLGSKMWMESRPYTAADRPEYGILLDMVGGRGARFHYEYHSISYAATATEKVWSEARRLGYGDIFIPEVGGGVTDDHVVLIGAGIPTTDIIECNNSITGVFPASWHTLADDITNIDPATLHAVGTTVLNVVYKERERP